MDIAAISFFPDYASAPQASFVYLQNRGNMQFVAHTVFEAQDARWLTMDAGDVDLDGDFVRGGSNVPKEVEERWRGRRHPC